LALTTCSQYRLTNSSIGHVYYVVENWDIERKPDSSLSLQIATAKSQTQIVSGFFLKETHKLSETIDFLRVLTENIVDTLRGQDLHVIPTRYISRATYVQLQRRLKVQHPRKPFHISFETFQSINGKNASQTAADVWAKMLLCVKGMSAEKVGAITKRYPTATAFWTGFKEKKREWEEEKLRLEGSTGKVRDLELFFADKVQGDGRQKIGDALSREVSPRENSIMIGSD
jgi:crossover junction endonuclease MUS81